MNGDSDIGDSESGDSDRSDSDISGNVKNCIQVFKEHMSTLEIRRRC